MASVSYLITCRRVRRGAFDDEPGPARFLAVPDGAVPTPEHRISRAAFAEAVIALGTIRHDDRIDEDCGDIAVFVHGYNTSPADVAGRHRQLERDLPRAGFRGAIVSFDWPSDDRAINYLEDRSDAKITALKLVDDGISLLAATQYRGCRINVHVVAHSMGAYVVRQAFDDADDRPAIAASNWNVSQLCLVAADISSASLSEEDARSRSLFRHSTRVTNYQNPYDAVLKLSDVKRVGVAPRAGRRGLPPDAPVNAVNVNCGGHFRTAYRESRDNGHSWYFEDRIFLEDLTATLAGDLDRSVIARRRRRTDGDYDLA